MDTFERIVNETLLSGIAPLQLRFEGVFDGYGECPLAYRAKTSLFTASAGALTLPNLGENEVGTRLTLRAVTHAIRAMQALLDGDRTTQWISVQASVALLLEQDVYDLLSQVLTMENCDFANKICLEFPPQTLSADRDKIRKGLADVKSLGFRIAIAPITADFALTSLMDLNVDQVVLSKELTALSTDRNHTGTLAAIVALLHTLDVTVVADGVTDDDQIRELTTIECFGFAPTLSYRGEFMLPLGERTQDEIVKDVELV